MFRPIFLAFLYVASFSLASNEWRATGQSGPQPTASTQISIKEPKPLAEGRAALRKGDYERAIAKLKLVSEAEPATGYNAQARFFLGRAYDSLPASHQKPCASQRSRQS